MAKNVGNKDPSRKTAATRSDHPSNQEIITRLTHIDDQLHKHHVFQEQVNLRVCEAVERIGEEIEKQTGANASEPEEPTPLANPVPAKKPCNCHKKQEGPDFADGVWTGIMLGMLVAISMIYVYRNRAYSLYWNT